MIPIINFKISLSLIVVILLTNVCCEKYKLCVVDGKGGFKRSGQFCPTLDHADSKVECVLGVDRLDCLRRISKGKADFSVFTPEDLVTATNSEIEVLLTNELRYTKNNFEYEVVAIISNSSGIKTRHDLEDKKFCHPGYGYETDWTRILSNYLEASIVPQLCETQITITENRIKASSNFFQSACKAGPWVNDAALDYELKRKYPNLCALCDSPSKCSTDDKYWGRRGALYCLTDGAGDITWARLDDVQYHFGLTSGKGETTPDGYSYLCPDDSIRPLNKNQPCTWVVKPWPVIATQRTKAQQIQDFISTLDRTNTYNTWQTALLNLIETYHQYIEKLEPIEAIESYLDRAVGFLNANSFTGCHPPRTIRICTTSIIENAKCNWLRESAAVYGIEPDLSCLKADNTTHCMMAVNLNAADIVMITPDLLKTAEKQYNLKTLFYETVNDNSKYLTVAVTKSNSTIKTLKDAQNKRACFPIYDGVAWNSAIALLRNQSLINTCPYDQALIEYFNKQSGCVPQLPKHLSKLIDNNTCQKNNVELIGDYRAIKCLLDDEGDIAFISKNSLINFIENPNENRYNRIKIDDFHTLCESLNNNNNNNTNNNNGCHLSWAPIGQAMVRNNSTDLWMKDTLSVFLQLDSLFGKNYKSLTLPLQMFGNFDGKSNILFHDDTVRLRNVPTSRNFDNMQRTYSRILDSINVCQSSSSIIIDYNASFLLLLLYCYVIMCFC